MATVYTERDVSRVEATGSLVEAAGGIAVVILSIVALTRTAPGILSSISVIILGAALLAEGGTIATEFSRLYSMAAGGVSASLAGGGMMTEVFVGATVLVLGVLAILGVGTLTLVPVAVIATGGMMLITAAGTQRLNEVRVQTSTGVPEPAQNLAIMAGRSAAGFQSLAAIAAIVLGIIALTSGTSPVPSQVALLVLGAAVAISGTAVTGSVMRLISR